MLRSSRSAHCRLRLATTDSSDFFIPIQIHSLSGDIRDDVSNAKQTFPQYQTRRLKLEELVILVTANCEWAIYFVYLLREQQSTPWYRSCKESLHSVCLPLIQDWSCCQYMESPYQQEKTRAVTDMFKMTYDLFEITKEKFPQKFSAMTFNMWPYFRTKITAKIIKPKNWHMYIIYLWFFNRKIIFSK